MIGTSRVVPTTTLASPVVAPVDRGRGEEGVREGKDGRLGRKGNGGCNRRLIPLAIFIKISQPEATAR